LQKITQIINAKKPQNVEQLIIFVKEELQISEQEALELVLKLQSDGKISFKKQSYIPQNFAAYLKTEQTYWYWITLFMAIATAFVAFGIPEDFYPLVYIRYILGSIFVLWLPGYTFIKALFPKRMESKKSEKNLDIIERIALSIGMSLALVPIVGLLLNYTPWGIRLAAIVLSLLALTVTFATAALIREYKTC
ncbi:MAG: DUF1616 domain-containing protein, partial [Candidatus Bathyarchaeia archaeon]